MDCWAAVRILTLRGQAGKQGAHMKDADVNLLEDLKSVQL
jgi:hypothetical protein